MQNGVARIPAARIGDEISECMRISQHRRETVFGKRFGHFESRLHVQYRARFMVHEKPDDIEDHLGFSDLCAEHQDDLTD